jgi:rhamnogalacturonyl hydrolase YesR
MFETDATLSEFGLILPVLLLLTLSVHGESASTALIVAAYYRFRKLAPWLSTAEMNEACDRAFDGVMAKVTDEGWMTQVSVPIYCDIVR